MLARVGVLACLLKGEMGADRSIWSLADGVVLYDRNHLVMYDHNHLLKKRALPTNQRIGAAEAPGSGPKTEEGGETHGADAV
ncbi:hypothetical protein ACFOHK_01100 [Falsigemmobacter intermedius]|uniref:Uncharacterized protein n=1 Tax=Falsigemmobacter intermedius TaxID=1553448 RepID=A0A451GH28_9RHOB|nr:hypothetical protein [Falsigemmobacter intermedius]RWY37352.1 hypothetical protein EP867_17355 [Falsigemmobacter intermedius]